MPPIELLASIGGVSSRGAYAIDIDNQNIITGIAHDVGKNISGEMSGNFNEQTQLVSLTVANTDLQISFSFNPETGKISNGTWTSSFANESGTIDGGGCRLN